MIAEYCDLEVPGVELRVVLLPPSTTCLLYLHSRDPTHPGLQSYAGVVSESQRVVSPGLEVEEAASLQLQLILAGD